MLIELPLTRQPLKFVKLNISNFPSGNNCQPIKRASSLVSSGGAKAMLRVALVVLALLVGYDHIVYNGKFANAGMRASVSVLRNFGVL
jgi:hypothetical protein